MSELRTQFSIADQQIQDALKQGLQVQEGLRLRIYGLAKQAKEGDCKMPMPPSSNTVLRSKWESWISFKGMSPDAAMQEHNSIVNTLVNNSTTSTPSAPKATVASKAGATPSQSIKRQGILYKQRDVFKGWRPRHFVLQDSLLHYYLDADDPVPRKTMELTGCSVIAVKPTTLDGMEYFPFVITHPKSPITYILSTTSKEAADGWMAAITEVATAPVDATHFSHGTATVDRLLERRPSPADAQDVADSKDRGLVDPEGTLKKVPKKFAVKIELAVEALLGAVAPDAEASWEVMFEKNGVVAKRRVGDNICVRGESTLPFNLADVFKAILDPESLKEIDPQLDTVETLDKFSPHTWLDCLKFKPVWPTSARDFTNVVHWRQLTNGTVVIVSFSEKMDDLKPIEDGTIRAELILGGYVLKSTFTGTSVNYVVQSDLKGTLPQSIVRSVSSSQPLILANLRNYLKNDKSAKGRRIAATISVKALRNIIEKVAEENEATGNEIVEIFGDGNQVAAGSSLPSKMAAPASDSASSSSGSKVEPKRRDPLESKLNGIALLIVLLPPLLYYVVDSKLRGIAFLAGVAVVARYLLRLQLGDPVTDKTAVAPYTFTEVFRRLPTGKILVRIPVDIAKLLPYLDSKREESELEITVTHLALKAIARAIVQIPAMNGHVIFGSFYPHRETGVDLSLALDLSPESVIMKVEDVDKKPLDYLANEILSRTKSLRTDWAAASARTYIPQRNPFLLSMPAVLGYAVSSWLFFLESQLGISIPELGLTAYPHGVCTVISSPNQEGESGLDLVMQPSADGSAFCSSAPIIITIGGSLACLRILPSLENAKVQGTPVLNLSAVIDSRMCSLSDARNFCAKVQRFLSDPQATFDASAATKTGGEGKGK